MSAEAALTERRSAIHLRVRGVVQGVGFRPFVSRLAREQDLRGWVRNDADGVEIHVQGPDEQVTGFLSALEREAPPASRIQSVTATRVEPIVASAFDILPSTVRSSPTVPITPDLAVCDRCLIELHDPDNRRAGYPFITCTDCGPRYSIVESLPYDRTRTTMHRWEMCAECQREYESAADRRFHAEPIACDACGPHYRLEPLSDLCLPDLRTDDDVVRQAAALLREGRILGIKGVGGYHLACDARYAYAVRALRVRKFRKERPFALMAKDLATAADLIELSPALADLLQSPAHPIVIARARQTFAHAAPDTSDLGVMLPYTPLQHLIFAAGAPDVLVMTSGNRSSEPLAYADEDARQRLRGLADALVIGDRPIARRVDDSIVQQTVFGPSILRRARGYAPAVVARLDTDEPILGLGADLKNSVALAFDGQVIASQHLGDLDQLSVREAFDLTIRDLLAIYHLEPRDLIVAHDAHPGYVSTERALALGVRHCVPVQHHRAHIASVLAERGALETPVIGIAFDGTGFGDDRAIWGGEFFYGSVVSGLRRVAHLRQALLPGGDAAARHPVQSAAGFLCEIEDAGDLSVAPFQFGPTFSASTRLARSRLCTFPTTSAGRLFDAVAALLGFTRPVTFEGQAAMWLEQQARAGSPIAECPWPLANGQIDYRPALTQLIEQRRRGVAPSDLALAFHTGLATALAAMTLELRSAWPARAVVLSGGVFQNRLLLELLAERLSGVPVWTPRELPANDGGIALGQVAMASTALPKH